MNPPKDNAFLVFDPSKACYQCIGNWSTTNLSDVLVTFKQFVLPNSKKLILNGKKITKFDSAGALALLKWVDALKKEKNEVEFVDFSQQQQHLINLVESKQHALVYTPPPSEKHSFLYLLGKESIYKLNQMNGLIVLIGQLSERIFAAIGVWRRFQFPTIVSNIDTCGIKALPIVGWLSFLIGIVIAYQLGLELETYGANIYIAYLSGLAIFREFGPLMTAIIIAGRTSSAFTAQIGSMKINEEIDALSTMGLSPIELLVVPKVLSLLIVLPLLIFWSDIFSILGAMLMSKFMLHVGYSDFLTRLQDSVGLKQMMLGLYKAPAFAMLIALVGCFQGFRVKFSADSVGHQTTKSVVQALFLIIIADAVYSVVYGWLDI